MEVSRKILFKKKYKIKQNKQIKLLNSIRVKENLPSTISRIFDGKMKELLH